MRACRVVIGGANVCYQALIVFGRTAPRPAQERQNFIYAIWMEGICISSVQSHRNVDGRTKYYAHLLYIAQQLEMVDL